MATAINLATTGVTSGTPLTSAPISVGAATEEAITFSNMPNSGFTLVLSTAMSDATYGFATGETGGHILPGVANVISVHKGRALYVNSTAGGDLYIRVF